MAKSCGGHIQSIPHVIQAVANLSSYSLGSQRGSILYGTLRHSFYLILRSSGAQFWAFGNSEVRSGAGKGLGYIIWMRFGFLYYRDAYFNFIILVNFCWIGVVKTHINIYSLDLSWDSSQTIWSDSQTDEHFCFSIIWSGLLVNLDWVGALTLFSLGLKPPTWSIVKQTNKDTI